MSIFDDLKKPIKVDGENIDPRYFEDNGDGTYTLTQTMIYNIVRDAMNFYKEQVFSLDSECLYHTEKLAEFKDTWQEKLNNDQRELKYGPQLKELEKRCHEDMQVAFSMFPTSIEELFTVADAGLLMPPKSTWFEPKLRSGLFLHKID